jgi:hypothetical protein
MRQASRQYEFWSELCSYTVSSWGSVQAYSCSTQAAGSKGAIMKCGRPHLFSARSPNWKSDCQLHRACLSVRMEQLGPPWTDFYKIRYMISFRKSVERIQVSLKSDKNNRSFTWRPVYIYDNIRWILPRMRNVSDKRGRENQNTYFFVHWIPPPPPENRALY